MGLIDRCRLAAVASRSADAVRGELSFMFLLRHGGTPRIALRYEIAGCANAPVLLIAGGISAGRHVLATQSFSEPGWWQAQAGSFDLDRYRLLAIDWVGADGSLDLPIDPADQAEAILSLIDDLRIGRMTGFVGASYGAMVGMHFAAAYPDRCGALLSISAAGRAHPFASACRSLQRRALSLAEAQGDPAAGVALARAMAMLTYRTPREFSLRFAAPPELDKGMARVAADDYLDAQGERHARRMSATAYRRLSESIDLHCIEPQDLRLPATFVAADSDALIPAEDVETFAATVPGARFVRIHSDFGHDAFLKEEGAIATILSDFLSSLKD